MASEPTIPSEKDLAPEGEILPPGDAFVLLSSPTLDLQRDDIIRIANDLRAKRVKFLSGKKDPSTAPKRIAATPESKAATTEHLKGLLGTIKL